jgi:hypothetical protein
MPRKINLDEAEYKKRLRDSQRIQNIKPKVKKAFEEISEVHKQLRHIPKEKIEEKK